MKKKQKLTSNIFLINKRFKKNEYYHYFELPNFSITVPIIKDKFLIVSQKRVPINEFNYEFPSGWVDYGETPIKSAARELLEETGFNSLIKPKKLLELYPEAGRLSNTVFAFFTNRIEKIKKEEKGIKTRLVSKNQLIKLITTKKFNNSAHIAVFYHYLFKFFDNN